MKSIYFDIETEPLPLDELQAMIPEFEAAANLKDPDKIQKSIDDKRAAWFDKAALSPETGRVVAIGLMQDENIAIIDCDDEAAGLKRFWASVAFCDSIDYNLVGFYSNSFDLPFLIKRSWKHKVDVPKTLRKGRFWNEHCIDLADVWAMGNRECSISLDRLSKYLGVGQKSGSGKDFAMLWKTDRPKAVEYLQNDIKLTRDCAWRLGL